MAFGGSAGCLDGSALYYRGQREPQTQWWSQPRFDGYATSYNPRPVGPRTSVTERWQLDISAPAARPVVAGGLAFLPTAEAVRAVDVRTGEKQWRMSDDDPPLWPQSVLYNDGLLYVARAQAPGLVALDGKTGDRQWQLGGVDSGITALTFDSKLGKLFVGDDQGIVYGLDPATGEILWRQQLFGPINTLAIDGGRFLLAGTEGGEVSAVLSEEGSGYWRQRFPGQISALATMSGGYNGTSAFVSVFGGPTFGIDPSDTGTTTWETDVWGSDSFVVAGQQVFVAGHRLLSLGLGSGNRQWTGGRTTQCGPAAAGDTVYAASESEVTAYKASGGAGVGTFRMDEKRWSYPVEGRPEQGMAVADGAVFVLTEGTGDSTSKAYALEES